MPSRVGPLKRAKLINGIPRSSINAEGTKPASSGFCERDVPERGPDVLGRRTGAVPPRLGHVQVLGPVPGDHLRQPRPPQEFDVLLPDPGAVPLGVGFPVDLRAAHIPAARMSLQQDRPAGQCAEQEVERQRSRVGPRRVAVPGHLHQVALGLREDPRQDLGERGGIPGPRDTSGPRPDRALRPPAPNPSPDHTPAWAVGGSFLAEGIRAASAGPLLLPEPEHPLFEPGQDRRVIPRRVEQPPARRLGVGPLVIVEHDPGEVAQLAVPLALRQQEPVERLAQAAFQGLREERLRVADEADLAPAQAGLLPDQPHQAVGVGAGGGLTLPVGDEDESGIPRCDAPLVQRPQDLAGETIDEQRSAWDRRNRDGSRPRRAGGAPRPAPRPASSAARYSGRTRPAARRGPRPRRRHVDRSPGRCGIRPGLPSIGQGGRRDRPRLTPRGRAPRTPEGPPPGLPSTPRQPPPVEDRSRG